MRNTRSLSVSDHSMPSPPNFSTLTNQPSPPSSVPESHSQFHPAFLPLLHHLSSPLHQLISSTTGLPHPDFPATLLAYHLLTASQLDSLAVHFHQVWPPVPATSWYPIRVPPWIGTAEEKDVDLATKRMRFGQFIGLRGCSGPRAESGRVNEHALAKTRNSRRHLAEREVMEMMMGWMEREWQNSLARAKEEEDETRVGYKRND